MGSLAGGSLALPRVQVADGCDLAKASSSAAAGSRLGQRALLGVG